MVESSHTEEFVRLLTENQRRLYVYVLALVGNGTDADEVLQDTNLVLWRKSTEYKPGTNFVAWALKTAYFEVMAFRKRQQREQLRFDPGLVDLLSTDATVHVEGFDSRRRALATCVSQLNERDREMLHLRYGLGDGTVAGSISELAQRVGRTVHATHQALHRVRMLLMDCVRRRMAAEEHL